MEERVLRMSFFVLLAALAAIFPLSAAAAVVSGYEYGRVTTQAAYPTLAKGLAPVLGAAVLGLILTAHSRRTRIDAIERNLLRFLDSRGEWTGQEWDDHLEQALISGASLGQYGQQAEDVQEALRARSGLSRLKSWVVRLFALPVLGLSLIVGLSLWAVPASEAFLLNNVTLNTTLLFFTSYGTLFAVSSLLTAFLLVLWE